MLPGQKYTLEDILLIVKRRKWWLCLPLVLCALTGFVMTGRIAKVYRSETTILVIPQRIPESYVRSTVVARIEDRLQTIQQQILSRSRLEPIIEELDLYPELRKTQPMENVIANMRGYVGIVLERGDAFRISFTDYDPLIAQKVTERLASMFIKENLRDRELLAEGTNEFIEAQLEEARQKLLEQEKKLEWYRRQHAGELPSQVESNLQVIESAQLQLQSLSEALNRDQERRLVLERQLGDLLQGELNTTPPAAGEAEAVGANGLTIAAGPNRTQSERELDQASAQLKALELRYKADHPDVAAALRLVKRLAAKVEAEQQVRLASETTGRDGESTKALTAAQRALQNRIREVRGNLRTVEGQIGQKLVEAERLQSMIQSYQTKVDASPTRETELIELTRDYSTMKNAYESLLLKREDSKVAANLERQQVGEQFKVLDAPRVPERHVYPTHTMITVPLTMAGLVIGFLVTAFLEFRDSSFKTEAEILRVLQLPVLALVPIMQSEPEVRAVRRRKMVIGFAVFVLAVGSAFVYMVWTGHTLWTV